MSLLIIKPELLYSALICGKMFPAFLPSWSAITGSLISNVAETPSAAELIYFISRPAYYHQTQVVIIDLDIEARSRLAGELKFQLLTGSEEFSTPS